MKTNRELLEAAARAAGLRVKWAPEWECFWIAPGQGLEIGQWNPLCDDAAAFRLAVRLKLEVAIWADGSGASAAPDGSGRKGLKWHFEDEHNHNGDLAAAARLAVVRAAAAMAEESPA